jgi:hypothetical protein
VDVGDGETTADSRPDQGARCRGDNAREAVEQRSRRHRRTGRRPGALIEAAKAAERVIGISERVGAGVLGVDQLIAAPGAVVMRPQRRDGRRHLELARQQLAEAVICVGDAVGTDSAVELGRELPAQNVIRIKATEHDSLVAPHSRSLGRQLSC